MFRNKSGGKWLVSSYHAHLHHMSRFMPMVSELASLIFFSHFLVSCFIILSISITACPEALSRNCSSAPTFLAFSASSPALTTRPHFVHSSIRSSIAKPVHFGIKTEASLLFPAERISLTKGCGMCQWPFSYSCFVKLRGSQTYLPPDRTLSGLANVL